MRQPGIESPVLSLDALVVRTARAWILTPGDGRKATRIDDDTLHALVRASGGIELEPDDPARAALESVGVALPSSTPVPTAPEPTAATHHATSSLPGPGGIPGGGVGSLRRDDTVAPLAGFVARVSAGWLSVEGLDGVRLTLDETDLALLEAVSTTTKVGDVLASVAAVTGSSASVDGELGRRLGRLAAAGRLDLVPSEPPSPAGDAVDVDDPAPEDQLPAPPPATGWKAFVRRHRFPGRRYLIRAYRRARRALHATGAGRMRAASDAPAASDVSDAPSGPTPEVPSGSTPEAPAPTNGGGAAASSPVDPGAVAEITEPDLRSDQVLVLASSFRREGQAFQVPLGVGRPGQTVDSLWDDLQYLIDHDLPARLVTDGVAPAPAAGATAADGPGGGAELVSAAHAYLAFEQFGILRHVMRVVQWDHGVDATTVLRRVVEVGREDPARYPLLNWVWRHFESFPLVPLGWRSFFNEVRRFLVDELDVPLTPALDSVLALQAFLLPEAGRRFPATISLAHDYVAYRADHTASLWTSGRAEPTPAPLGDYGPGTITVYSDPFGRCAQGLGAEEGAPTSSGHWELDSPLVSFVAGAPANVTLRGRDEQVLAGGSGRGGPGPVRV